MSSISTIEELEELYGKPGEGELIKEVGHITEHYRKLIEASPFMILATSGPEGLDCSPRGDEPGFVRVVDDQTLIFPDRRGNKRKDSLKNIIRDNRVAVLFLIPGVGVTLRVIGKAHISIDSELLQSFAVGDKLPRSAIVIRVESVYFQCARAIVRSNLWDPKRHISAQSLPSAGEILAALSNNKYGGERYDLEWPERASKTLW